MKGVRVFALLVFVCLWDSPLFPQDRGAFPVPVFQRSLGTHTFDRDFDAWQVETHGRLIHSDGALELSANEPDPAVYHLFDANCSQVRLRMKVKTRIASECEIYWLTKEIPLRDTSRMAKIAFAADNNWNDYEVVLPVSGHLTCVSLKILGAPGSWWFDSIDLLATVPHPLTVQNARREPSGILFNIANTTQETVSFVEGTTEGAYSLPSRSAMDMTVPLRENGSLAHAELKLNVSGFPAVTYPVFLYQPQENADWITRPLYESRNYALRLEVARDASMARIVRTARVPGQSSGEEAIAVLAPLVHRGGTIPKFEPNFSVDGTGNTGNELAFTSEDLLLNITLARDEIAVAVEPKPTNATDGTDAANPKDAANETEHVLEGPAVRVLGPLHGGLLCGVEYLGPGDVSSSPLDIKEPNNDRATPSPQWMTIPLAAFASDSVAIGLLWDDMTLQPVFSSPNHGDLSSDHRMALRGKRISAVLKILDPDTLRSASDSDSSDTTGENGTVWPQDPITGMLSWAVRKRGVPQPPPFPRTAEEQSRLSLSALEGPLLGTDRMSWGYCVEPNYPREPYADVLSCLYRLKGELPQLSGIVPDGGIVTDDAIYFLGNRVLDWKQVRGEDVRNTLAEMEPDGSVYRRSLFPEWEPGEKTSLGYCARKADFLLDYHRITGDAPVLQAAERILKFIGDRSVPRGGYYWETTLHTPDLLSAAYASRAFLRAFEATQHPPYLEKARHFALAGLPFVYLWNDPEKPIQLYATVPLFGASQRETTRFATAQPWAGIIYGYTLNMLARHDTTHEWKTIATGILAAAERMQYPDGPYAGCLPDLFALDSQTRYSLKLNPCGLVFLRRAIQNETQHVTVLDDGMDRIAAPFPLQTNRRGVIVRDVPTGFRFEILRNGQRVESVTGSGNGRDQLKL